MKSEPTMNPEASIHDSLSLLMTAVSNCSLYTEKHPSVAHFSEKVLEQMMPMAHDGVVDLTLLDNTLLVNEIRVPLNTIHANNIVSRLKRKGIEKIVIRQGITADEFAAFVGCLASPVKKPVSSPHLAFGVMEVMLRKDNEDTATVMDRNTEQIREIHRALSRFGTLDLVGLEDVVLSFIGTIHRESSILKVVCPVKSYSEYTFTHTSNVTVVSIYLAEALGLQGDLLHDIGLAGLLHDVGKMFVPKEVLDKESKLEPAEWELMKQHTVLGASYLSRQPNIPKLALLAAYEHHLRFDGTGYPEPVRRGKKQHLVSQIVAVADFFDALRTERPYRKSLPMPAVIGLLEEASGTLFQPDLVMHFIRTLKTSGIWEGTA